MAETVLIHSSAEAPPVHPDRAVVVLDVIRASTTAVTALAQGRRVFPVVSVREARVVAARLSQPLLAGELEGQTPPGFDETNSPAAIEARTDFGRPLVLLSSSGTKTINEARGRAVYVACIRNALAQTMLLIERHPHVAIVGAATKGQFRLEDQLCAARIAEGLIAAGYRPVGRTADLVDRCRDQPLSNIGSGASANYLRRSGQDRDLDFVLGHIDDLDAAFELIDGEIIQVSASSDHARAPGEPTHEIPA